MKNKINIGTASIILIFIILCLSVFALLSLSDARSAEVFSKRRADSVYAYYQTDMTGQRFVQSVAKSLKKGDSASDCLKQAASGLPDGSTVSEEQAGRLICEIPMSAGQSLHIELEQENAEILAYYVYNSEDYAIDEQMPVWTEREP